MLRLSVVRQSFCLGALIWEGVIFENIDRLVTKEGYGLRAWDDRYSKGVWVCIAPVSAQLEEIDDASDAGDLDMIPAMEFVNSVSWLPFITGNNLMDAMNKLEALLKALPEEDTKRTGAWADASYGSA